MPRTSDLFARGQRPGRIGGVRVSQQPLQWMRAAAQTGKHGAGEATCAMCGTELPVSLMVPDGGEACTDVRWYCRDTVACTERWTEIHARRVAADERDRLQEPENGHLEHEGPSDEQVERQAPANGHAEHQGQPNRHAEHQVPANGHVEHQSPDDRRVEHERPDDGHEEHEDPDDEQCGHPVTGASGTR